MNKPAKTDLGNQEIFSRNLKRYIVKSGEKQKDIAKAVGVSTGTFCDWVNLRAYPRMDKLQALADYFGIQKSDLVEDPNVKKTISEQDKTVIDLFHLVPEEKREFVLSLIEAAIDKL